MHGTDFARPLGSGSTSRCRLHRDTALVQEPRECFRRFKGRILDFRAVRRAVGAATIHTERGNRSNPPTGRAVIAPRRVDRIVAEKRVVENELDFGSPLLFELCCALIGERGERGSFDALFCLLRLHGEEVVATTDEHETLPIEHGSRRKRCIRANSLCRGKRG